MEHISRTLSPALSAIRQRSPITPSSISDWQPILDAYEPSLASAVSAARAFVGEMEAKAPARWLTLSGQVGCGKTFLARQIFAQAERINPGSHKNSPVWLAGDSVYERRRPKCRWHNERAFSSIVRGGDYQYPYYLGDDYFVCLDDLGSERDNSAFIAQNLFDLCNARLGKWTLFTTNYTVAELTERIDSRVASRLIRDENTFLRIKAGDYALRPKPTQLPLI
jgi:hypothetical protein